MRITASSRQPALPGHQRAPGWERAAALLWAGMVLGVSFVATPAKFLVKSLPRPVALDVGRETFRVFGQVEIAPAILLALCAARSPSRRLLAAIPGAVVLAQTFWLRPLLAARPVSAALEDTPPPTSTLHNLYVASELLKLGALFGLGLMAARPRRVRKRRRAFQE